MPFSSLTGAQQIAVRLYLLGGPAYRAEMHRSAAATKELTLAAAGTSSAMLQTTKRTFMMNQALFMARRGLFYMSLGLVAVGAAVIKMGFDFNRSMQEARVALTGFLPNQQAITQELRAMYVLAAKTPFEFPELILSARRLQSFTGDLKLTNQLVEALTDGLSAMGILTGAALQRATLALSHMFAIGHLNGQVLLQLNRDNIQMTKALMWYYHATGEEVKKSVSQGLVTAADAARAFIGYMKTPGFRGAAWRQANQTLYGAWTTFKDIIRMGSASSQAGLFEGLRRTLQKINDALIPMATRGEDITLVKVAQAIDKVISPRSHAVINFFLMFEYALKTTAGSLFVLFKTISLVLVPFDKLFGLFGANRLAARFLGIAIGFLVTMLIIQKTVMGTVNFFLTTYGALLGMINVALRVMSFALGINTTAQMANSVMLRQMAITIFAGYIPAIWSAVAATWAWTIALLANPITWVVLGIVALIYVLILLYTRWRWFHDLVNKTTGFLKEHWKIIGAIVAVLSGLGPAILLVKLLADHWKRVALWAERAYNWINKFKGPSGIDVIKKVGHYAAYALPPGLVGHQMGGMIAGGLSLVGERGPELVQLPGGSRITPNSQVEKVELGGLSGGGGSDRPIVVNLVVDRKVLATAVARANQDYASRR